jgi:hypothetical protein
MKVKLQKPISYQIYADDQLKLRSPMRSNVNKRDFRVASSVRNVQSASKREVGLRNSNSVVRH